MQITCFRESIQVLGVKYKFIKEKKKFETESAAIEKKIGINWNTIF